jgi:DNA polymerase-3 subunit gamma/tau
MRRLRSSTEIRAGNAVDVIEIDAATNRGIDEIRRTPRGRPLLSWFRDRFKIILDEAHQITDAAFNALLKTLRSPHTSFMLATTQPDIPRPSARCQYFRFSRCQIDAIVAQLRGSSPAKIEADDDALALLAGGDGSMRDALYLIRPLPPPAMSPLIRP